MKGQLQTFMRYRYLLEDLVIRDIKVKYRRSFLGLVWSILNPLLMMMVITAVFSRVFKISIPNFPIYYLTGSTLYSFFSEATSNAMTSTIYAAPLIKKVYIPKYIFPLEKAIFAFVNLMFSFIAVIIMFLVLRHPITWTILLFPIPVLYLLVFSIGVGLILSVLCVFFRDMMHLYGVFLTALMYLTPIIYPVDILPENIKFFVQCNPLYYYVDYFRQVTMYGTVPSLSMNLICIFLSLLSLTVGLLIFKKYQDKFILYI